MRSPPSLNAPAAAAPLQELPWVGDSAPHGGSGGGHGTHQQGSRAHALAPFEISVAGAHRVLPRTDRIAVHSQAHRTSGLAPVGAGVLENLSQSQVLRVAFDLLRTRHDEQLDSGRHLAALQDAGSGLQILTPDI